MKLYEMLIDETQELFGVNALSIVENPAIQSDFVALGDEKPVMLAEVSKDKQILMGACLIPDKPIFRKGENEDYYIYFSSLMGLPLGMTLHSCLQHNLVNVYNHHLTRFLKIEQC